MRADYYRKALEIVDDPYTLVNMIWARAKMLQSGSRPLVASAEKLPVEDVVLREIIEGRITHVLGDLIVLDGIGDLAGTVKTGH